MRSVAARPTSAEISSSSSASMVSTSSGRLRCSPASACWTISSKRLTICSFVRVRLSRSLSKNPKSQVSGTTTYDLPTTLTSLCFLRPQHQIVQRRARVLASREQFRYLGRNRQLDAVARRQFQRRIGRAHAFRDHLHARQHVRQRAAARQLETDVTIAAQAARARQHEIAEPGEAGERLALRPGRAGEARNFCETARDETRLRVPAEAEAFGNAGGDRDDVLQRAADFDTDHIARAVQPEV